MHIANDDNHTYSVVVVMSFSVFAGEDMRFVLVLSRVKPAVKKTHKYLNSFDVVVCYGIAEVYITCL